MSMELHSTVNLSEVLSSSQLVPILYNFTYPPTSYTGGFNQPIMCGGEPRVMTRRDRGEADLPFYTIKIRPPKHGIYTIL